jgi:hypothetical protein
MDGIIQDINVAYSPQDFISAFTMVSGSDPLDYIECGAKSWVLSSNPSYEEKWHTILAGHREIHPELCDLATGFNYNQTPQHGVPPHVDIDRQNSYNLLLPIVGSADIIIYETNECDLEFRHGKTHWKMLKPGREPTQIMKYQLDRPTILNTRYLHEVCPTQCPRLVWCTRWINIPQNISLKDFAITVTESLNAPKAIY